MNRDSFLFWNEKYKQGFIQMYPWDSVVSFVYRHYPEHKPRYEINILEVGCGTASNLWFAAREGFNVTGIDCSEEAIRIARERFQSEGLKAELSIGSITEPFAYADNYFDMVIDRASITHVGMTEAKATIKEIYRVLAPAGKLFFNPYSKESSSYRCGKQVEDELTININKGSLMHVGQICFYDESSIKSVLEDYKILSFNHIKQTDIISSNSTHAEWQIIACK